MRADDPRNFANLPGPWNLKEEIETVDDMGFDLEALIRTEAPLRNGKIANFFRRKYRLLEASRVAIGLPRDFEKALKLSFRKYRRLICLEDGFKSAFDLGSAKTIFFIERCNARQRLRPVHFDEHPNFLALLAGLHFHVEIIEAVGDEVDLQWIKLFSFDEDILAHADLPKIVQ